MKKRFLILLAVLLLSICAACKKTAKPGRESSDGSSSSDSSNAASATGQEIGFSLLDLGYAYTVWDPSLYGSGTVYKNAAQTDSRYWYIDQGALQPMEVRSCSGVYTWNGTAYPFSFSFARSADTIVKVEDLLSESKLKYNLLPLPGRSDKAVFIVQQVEDWNISDLWILDLESGLLSELVGRQDADAFFALKDEGSRYDFAVSPQFSPDGRFLLFRSNRNSYPRQDQDVFVRCLETGDEWKFEMPDDLSEQFHSVNLSIQWLDRQILIFDYLFQGSAGGLLYDTVTRQFTNPLPLTRQPDNPAGFVSGGVFYQYDANTSYYKNALTGEKSVVYLPDGRYEDRPLASDGNYVAFCRADRLDVYDLATGGTRRFSPADLQCETFEEGFFYDENTLILKADKRGETSNSSGESRYLVVSLHGM